MASPRRRAFPLVPRHRAHAALEIQPYGWLSLFFSGTFVGAQRLRGDEENVAPKLDPWFSLEGGVRASAGGFVAWIRCTNLLDARYSTFGAFAPNPSAARAFRGAAQPAIGVRGGASRPAAARGAERFADLGLARDRRWNQVDRRAHRPGGDRGEQQ